MHKETIERKNNLPDKMEYRTYVLEHVHIVVFSLVYKLLVGKNISLLTDFQMAERKGLQSFWL